MHPTPKDPPKKRKSKHIVNPHPPFGATCFVCGRTDNLQTHEIYGGSNRNLSIKYGLQVFLCREHHTGTDGVHGRDGKPLADHLRWLGQTNFEMFSGTREAFVRQFGRSYL